MNSSKAYGSRWKFYFADFCQSKLSGAKPANFSDIPLMYEDLCILSFDSDPLLPSVYQLL